MTTPPATARNLSEETSILVQESRNVDPNKPLVEIRDLEIGFTTQGGVVHALKGVSFDIYPGETVAIVGESGSGKSTTAHGIINLLPENGKITGGSVRFEGKDLTTAKKTDLYKVRGRDIGFVPQDPMSNLNPVWNVGFQVREAIKANGIAHGKKEVNARAIQVLQEAGLRDAEHRMAQYPHQFSGGMRQRVLIGIGLAANPKLLIADEPTSALDVTVQRVILDHLEALTRERNTALLLITHDLGLAAERATKLIVMYQGKIVEAGPSLKILQNPQHPYTKRLIESAPSLASQRIAGAPVAGGTSKSETDIDVAAIAASHDEAAARAKRNAQTVVEVNDLTKVYSIRKGNFKSTPLTAVDNISFKIPKGTTLALVGESGSGKTTAAKMVLGLEQPTSGEIILGGTNLTGISKKELFAVRRKMQPVFQDPYGSLDPQRSIGAIIGEPLKVHKVGDVASRKARIKELLDQVSMPAAVADRYPNELSGGQRQRVAIARALALKPEIVVLDEAVSALDVLVQAQILQLLADLQSELDLTYLFITHDLAVVRVVADEIAVMEQGKIVESGTADQIFGNAQTEYTQKLLEAIPGSSIKWGKV